MTTSVSTLRDTHSTRRYRDVFYETAAEYRAHFSYEYCTQPIQTFDGIDVHFREDDFDHAFYEGYYKDFFSWRRADRIDWIGSALRDPLASLHPGYDKGTDAYRCNRRVCFVGGDYVVIIEFVGSLEARFKTAYIANGDTPWKIRESPPWR